MTKAKTFTPWDFFQLAREAAEHEAELKIRLFKAGLGEQRTGKKDESGA